MKPKPSRIERCECGHTIGDHEICDCPNCPDGVHGCFAKMKNGNFCECEDYESFKKSGGKL